METRPKEHTRRQDLDIVKGLAIIAVVLIHVSGHFLSRLSPYDIPWLALATLNRALQFAVPAFLMVSAFLYTTKLQRSPNTKSVICHKASGIIIPYLIWSAIGLLFNYGSHWDALGGRHLVKILLLGRAMYHLYFLVLLLQMIVIIPCIAAWFPKHVRCVPLMIGIAFLQTAVYLLNRNYWQYEYIGTCILWYLPSIALGIWLAQNEQRMIDLRRIYFLPIMAITALSFGVHCPLALSVLQHGSANTTLFQASAWIYTTGACLLLICVSHSRGAERRLQIPAKLGTHSFAIYIAHPFVIFALDRILAYAPGLHSGAVMALYIACCLGIPLMPTFIVPLFFRIKYYIRSFNWMTSMAWRRALLGLFVGLTFFAATKPSQGSPILQQFIASGWSPNADLQAQIVPLPGIGTSDATVQCYSVRFTSHVWHGKPVRIFGFYGVPKHTTQRIPGLLLVHGGGGYATQQRVIEGANHGFATLSIDLPGKGTHRENHSRSTGPDMTVAQIFTVTPQVSESYVYHAVLAEMRAITFLSRRPEVDAAQIGLVGASWGGATGLITTSLDKRVRCFVDICGSGFVKEGSCWEGYFAKMPPAQFASWQKNYDASQYLNQITVPVLGIAATNDTCYWLPQFLKTMHAIHPTPDLICLANLNHKINPQAHAAFYRWLQIHLQTPGQTPSPQITQQTVIALSQSLRMSFKITAPTPAMHVSVSYASAISLSHAQRHWIQVPASRTKSGFWMAALPVKPNSPIYAFSTAEFADGTMSSSTVHTMAQIAGKDFRGAVDVPTMNPNHLRPQAQNQHSDPMLALLITIDIILVMVVLGLPRPKLSKLKFRQARPEVS